MNKKIIVSIVAIVVIVAVSFVWWQGMSTPAPKYTGPVEKVSVGAETSLWSSLLWVAENKGYFQENGVEVSIKEFDSGRAAFTSMLDEGGLDMITVAQAPIMFNSFNRSDFAITANMVSSDNEVWVLARRDRGITKVEDLRGKKVGVTKGSGGQYFLGLFLTANNIRLSEVEQVDIPAGQLVSSITAGTVDAISVWQPYIHNAQQALGDKSITFPNGKIFRSDFYLVSNPQFLQNHPETITRFLKALEQAEGFIETNKDESIVIVSKRLGLENAFVSSTWDDYQFGLFLDQIIIQTLESAARWAIQNKLTDKTKVPNYLNFIYFDALEKVKQEAVTIIR